jgi:hypothetical protein
MATGDKDSTRVDTEADWLDARKFVRGYLAKHFGRLGDAALDDIAASAVAAAAKNWRGGAALSTLAVSHARGLAIKEARRIDAIVPLVGCAEAESAPSVEASKSDESDEVKRARAKRRAEARRSRAARVQAIERTRKNLVPQVLYWIETGELMRKQAECIGAFRMFLGFYLMPQGADPSALPFPEDFDRKLAARIAKVTKLDPESGHWVESASTVGKRRPVRGRPSRVERAETPAPVHFGISRRKAARDVVAYSLSLVGVSAAERNAADSGERRDESRLRKKLVRDWEFSDWFADRAACAPPVPADVALKAHRQALVQRAKARQLAAKIKAVRLRQRDQLQKK